MKVYHKYVVLSSTAGASLHLSVKTSLFGMGGETESRIV